MKINESRRIGSWGRLIIGSAMLSVVLLAATVKLCNEIGVREALAVVVGSTVLIAWVVVGLALVMRGLNKI